MEEAGSEAISRKRKKLSSEGESLKINSEKKAKNFCVRTFRQELKGNDALKGLKKFIASAQNSDDVIFEYLEKGGSLQEILSLIDSTAPGDLTTALPVFEALHLIFLRFQTVDSKYHQRCKESARNILCSNLFILKAMLSMNIAKQKKVALKILTAIVTLDSSFANEILNVFVLSPALIIDLIQPSPEKESVRKCFIFFVLSFLVEGNSVIIKNLLDKKGFLSSIIPDLKFDEAATVNVTLSLFEEKILKNVNIPKTLKLKTFNTQVIKSLFELYDWKGVQGIKQILPSKKNKALKDLEINQNEKEMVIESVHSFLMLLCSSQKFGVAFYNTSMWTSNELHNQLLFTVFESLPDPLKNKKISEVMLRAIKSCPDLMTPILLKLEPSFQPRNSKNWFQAMEFAEKLIREIDSSGTLRKEAESVTAAQIIKVGKTLCAPEVFLKFAKLGSQKSQLIEIRLCSLTLLTVIWVEIQKLFAFFQNFESDLKKSLLKHIYKFLPDVEDLIELWHTLCDVQVFANLPFSEKKKILFLSAILESLHMISKCQKHVVISPFKLDTCLLSPLENIKGSISQGEFEKIQVKIVQLMEIDYQALMSNMELFEKFLLILLRSTDEASLSHLSKFLASLEVFRSNKPELEVWLLSFLSLPLEYRSSVADFLVESVRLFYKKNKEGDEDMKMNISNDSASEESFTPLILNCVEILKSYSSKTLKKNLNFQSISYYLNDVLIHLQHFYTIDVYFYDYVKGVKALGKSVLNYLKSWKYNSIEQVDVDVFPCRLEFNLVSWLLKDPPESSREIIDVENTHLLKRYSLFRIAVSYLNSKIISTSFSRSDVEKFTTVLSMFLSSEPEDDRENVDLISFDIKNKALYQRNCLNFLFRNNYLLNKFDIFQESQNDTSCTTEIILKLMIESEIIKNLNIKKKLSEPWKCRFLKQLKAKLENKNIIDSVNNLEMVLNFFEYGHQDIREMVELLLSVSTLNLFINKNRPSAWIVILTKFIELHCRKEELNGIFVKKLCLIMEHLRSRNCLKLENLENCFVDLLRKHPCHLLLIDNEFLNVILLAKNTTYSTCILGKLLLNDPTKVKHFLHFIKENLDNLEEPQVMFSLLSTLIENDYSFFNETEFDSLPTVERISEASPIVTSDIFKVLEIVYKKYKKNIFKVLLGKKNDFILSNLTLTRELIKLFLNKEEIKNYTKEIIEGKFEPELVFEVVKKMNLSEVTENYIRGLLSLFCQIIKKSEDLEDDIWRKYCLIVANVVEFVNESPLESIIQVPEWKEFTKLALGRCLNSMEHVSLLKILLLLIKTFHKSEQLEDCGMFFQMLISHSQFLKVMLNDSPLKTDLVELFHCLIGKSPSEMSSKHFPVLLASYTASLSLCDRKILQILRFYEIKQPGVSIYEPYVWGDSAVSHYSIGTNFSTSLWQRFNMANILDLLDDHRLELSLREFPIFRSLEANQDIDCNSEVYDPAFILPLFINLLSPGAVVFSLSFIYKGGLAYTVRALSSECKDIRLLASLVLTRFYNHLELNQKLKQKLVWMHFINCFRYGIEDLSAKPLPNIITLFFARMTLELSSQSAEMYLPLQNFLLAKPYFTFYSVPEFFPLFHSSEMSHWKYRFWLLEVIRDGTKTCSDMKIIFHTMALKAIFCFFSSQICNIETKKLILQAVESMLKIEKSALLISDYGLLNWIAATDFPSVPTILCDLLNLLRTLTTVILKDIQITKSKRLNFSHLIQILNFAVKLLPTLKHVKSVANFKLYLNILNECFKLFAREGKTDWFKRHKNYLFDIVDAGVVILGENYDYSKYFKVPFYFRSFDDDCDFETLKSSIFLFNAFLKK